MRKMLALLRSMTGDESLVVLKMRAGSIKITLGSTRKTSSTLATLLRSGASSRLRAELDLILLDVREGDDLQGDERARGAPPETMPPKAPADAASSSEDELLWLERWRAGDRSAGSKLLSRHFAGLYRFFASKADENRDVEDLIQQTFIAVVEGRERLRGDISSFRGYLYAAARNILFSHYRSQRRLLTSFDEIYESLESLAPSPFEALNQAVQEQVLLAALRRLPLDAQIILELLFWENLTHTELSVVFGVSLGVVKGRLQRASHLLRNQIQEVLAERKQDVGSSVSLRPKGPDDPRTPEGAGFPLSPRLTVVGNPSPEMPLEEEAQVGRWFRSLRPEPSKAEIARLSEILSGSVLAG